MVIAPAAMVPEAMVPIVTVPVAILNRLDPWRNDDDRSVGDCRRLDRSSGWLGEKGQSDDGDGA